MLSTTLQVKSITITTDSDGNTITTSVLSTFDNVTEGVFYVKRVDSLSIKLSKSRSNLFNDIFVTLKWYSIKRQI